MKNLDYLNKYRLKEKELKICGISGDSGNGFFKIFIKGKSFFVAAANGGGWEHVSIFPATGRKNGAPTWDEMYKLKDMFFEPEEYVNIHENCLHLWRCTSAEQPIPPIWFV